MPWIRAFMIYFCQFREFKYILKGFSTCSAPNKQGHIFILWVDNLKSNDEGNIKEIE